MNSHSNTHPPLRSVLFVSALQVDAFPEALASVADLVCLDLEDGVPASQKDLGRECVLSALEAAPGTRQAPLAVRVNSMNSADGLNDMLALCDTRAEFQVILPKIISEAEVIWVAELLKAAGKAATLHCVIETCEALHRADAIAKSSPSVRSLMFGAYDLSAALGVSMEWETLQYARSRVVHAAASAAVDVLDAPHLVREDLDGLLASTQRSQRFGFTGRISKDVTQIETINSVFTPSLGDLSNAADIVARFEASPYAHIEVNGKIIELPEIRAIKRILAMVGKGGTK